MLDFGFYNMDCMDGMAKLPTESIDLIITSPPYNLGATHHTGDNKFKPYESHDDDMPEKEYQKWQIDVLNECHRVLKQDGSMFYNHKNRIKEGLQITPYEWILQSNFIVKQELIWHNGGQNLDKIRFYPMTERVYWLAKSHQTKLFNVISHHDIFNWPSVGSNGIHKRPFPIEMCNDIIACFPKAKTALDPFMGSGTVGIACHNHGINFIGFEVDADCCKSAIERLEAVKSQTKLF